MAWLSRTWSTRLLPICRSMRQTWHENWLSILVIVGLALAFTLLRSSPSDVASVEAFDQQVAASPATLAYFYSNT